MVERLHAPARPLPRGGIGATASVDDGDWFRVYHGGSHSPTGERPRTFGPIARFDPHRPDQRGQPGDDPDGRSVLYAAADLITGVCEVFGEARAAPICPRWRVARLRPTRPLRLFDLTAPGSALAIGALPQLADGQLPRALTQAWAQALYEDDPLGHHVDGVTYRSAYNGGVSLAVWDSTTVLRTVEDRWLGQPAVWDRLIVGLLPRRIDTYQIDPDECPRCRDDPTTAQTST